MIVQHSRLNVCRIDGNIQSQQGEQPPKNTSEDKDMTNKAKTYLKNIQEADTEKKLVGM